MLGASKGAAAQYGHTSSNLISVATASNGASIEFTLPTTYNQVTFGFYNITPATDDAVFAFQVNAVGESGFNETITSTAFRSRHHADNSPAEVGYNGGSDQAQGTGYQHALPYIGNEADECGAGEMHLFAPSSTTYVKHFYITGNNRDSGGSYQNFISGYINTTTALSTISFKMTSGNISSGTIKMWGIK